MDIPSIVALLTLLGSCCGGLVLLVALVVGVALVLTGRVKKAEMSGPGVKVALEAADQPKPEALAPAEPAPAPSLSPADGRPANVVVGDGVIDASSHDDHSVHIDAKGDVAYGNSAHIHKPQE